MLVTICTLCNAHCPPFKSVQDKAAFLFVFALFCRLPCLLSIFTSICQGVKKQPHLIFILADDLVSNFWRGKQISQHFALLKHPVLVDYQISQDWHKIKAWNLLFCHLCVTACMPSEVVLKVFPWIRSLLPSFPLYYHIHVLFCGCVLSFSITCLLTSGQVFWCQFSYRAIAKGINRSQSHMCIIT